jgi:hypothetical protein
MKLGASALIILAHVACAPPVTPACAEDAPSRPAAVAPKAAGRKRPATREAIIEFARADIRRLITDTEDATGLRVEVRSLPKDTPVVAQYFFDTRTSTPRVELRPDWEDVDVAHELMHMRIELVEGYRVLAWRRGVERTKEIEAAFGRVRCYIDDDVVHARLARAGYRVDGEVIKPPLFDSIYTNCARFLEEGRPRARDGMGHLDPVGRGDLCRAAFLVQAELIIERYADELPAARLELARRFVRAFRANRKRETAKADRVLALFKEHDVMTPEGHLEILNGWARLEDLDKFVGASAYRRRGERYILPWP